MLWTQYAQMGTICCESKSFVNEIASCTLRTDSNPLEVSKKTTLRHFTGFGVDERLCMLLKPARARSI